MKMVSVTNRSRKTLVERYNGVPYHFAPNESQSIPVEAAKLIFGYGEEDKVRALTRLGWLSATGKLKDALAELKQFEISEHQPGAKVLNPLIEEVFVTNLNRDTHKDRFDGTEYEFKTGEEVLIPKDAAKLFFGYGEADKTRALSRLGKAGALVGTADGFNAQTKSVQAGMAWLDRFKIKKAGGGINAGVTQSPGVYHASQATA